MEGILCVVRRWTGIQKDSDAKGKSEGVGWSSPGTQRFLGGDMEGRSARDHVVAFVCCMYIHNAKINWGLAFVKGISACHKLSGCSISCGCHPNTEENEGFNNCHQSYPFCLPRCSHHREATSRPLNHQDRDGLCIRSRSLTAQLVQSFGLVPWKRFLTTVTLSLLMPQRVPDLPIPCCVPSKVVSLTR